MQTQYPLLHNDQKYTSSTHMYFKLLLLSSFYIFNVIQLIALAFLTSYFFQVFKICFVILLGAEGGVSSVLFCFCLYSYFFALLFCSCFCLAPRISYTKSTLKISIWGNVDGFIDWAKGQRKSWVIFDVKTVSLCSDIWVSSFLTRQNIIFSKSFLKIVVKYK